MTVASLPSAGHPVLVRGRAWAAAWGLRMPVLMAPMAGASPVPLAQAVSRAGGMAALGALLMEPPAIVDWVDRWRAGLESADAPLQINLWVPDPPPQRDPAQEAAWRTWLAAWGPPVEAQAGDARPPDFEAQCEAVLAARPAAVSSIMGLLPAPLVHRMKARGIRWLATVTTVAEARAAEAAGADVLVAQGAEAGGHRGAFQAAQAQDDAIGLLALLPQVVDAVRLPVIATGGIADGRGVAAALLLGACGVQVGTALLRSPEAAIPPAWAAALAGLAPEDTRLTRAFSGRWGRAVETAYVQAAAAPGAPAPLPYPVQRGMTAAMRRAAEQAGDLQRMQAWAGQAAALARPESAGQTVQRLWAEAVGLLER